MKDIQDFCLELKNDILIEIGEYTNWDIVEYPMKFFIGSREVGLIILKKNNQETKRILQKKFGYFGSMLKKLIDPTKINKGILSIYPDGTYQSSFIWHDEANLERLLKDIFIRKRTFVEYIFTSFEEDVLKDRYNHLSIVVNIKKHKEIHIERKMTTISGEIKEMALILEKRYIEAILDFQLQTNELELGEKAIKWNRATFSIPGDIFSFDPDKDVSFEWREENA